MKTHASHPLLAGLLGVALTAAFSGAVSAMDPDGARLVNQGWVPHSETASHADGNPGSNDPCASSSSYVAAAYQGTSMRANAENEGELGFTDPRPGDSSY